MDTELRCHSCIEAVILTPRLLVAGDFHDPDPSWVIGEDAFFHWVRDGAAVCDAEIKVLKK